MSYTALYRKWRPTGFKDVKGQDHIVRTLKNQITSNRIGHAYLFCGTRGTGKTSIAKIFARAVNCENPLDGSPCGQCRTCKNIASGSSLNVVEIDAASNNGVENIRDIREQVQYPPTEGRYRVYIIDEVHMLSTGAFNALLKTLEEPPSYVVFILATTEVHRIPITVLSRCQRYDFKRITIQTLTDRLKELSLAEQIQVEEKALAYIAKAADGSMRDALSLLDQCVAFHFGETLTYDHVLDILGAVDTAIFSRMFRAVAEEKTRDCICQLEELVLQGRELGQFVTDFTWYLRNLLLLQASDDAEDLLDMSSDNKKLLEEDARMTDGETLMRYIRVFSELSNQIRYAAQKRVLVELAFIKLTKPQMEHNYDSIIERLNKIEEQLEEGIFAAPPAGAQISGLSPVSPVPAGTQPQAGTQLPEGGAGLAAGIPVPVGNPPGQVSLPRAQLEDLQLIRNEWGKIVKSLGGVIRSSFRDTVVEPSGDSCLCVVFLSVENYEIGRRPTIMGELETYVKNTYGKDIYFKSRLIGSGERLDTIYVSEEELKEHIHMDIVVEED
ncbi:MAG: DNA polymerase III subunit gamma/tau [Hungatella sp.]|nr:DNA polymerase III subunit gamma/tau [Hungatella sp.]